MDRFPEAFRRFESDVDVGRFESYHQLTLAFQSWAGQRWKGTTRQYDALDREARNLGFEATNIYGHRRVSFKSDRDVLFSQLRGWREENIVVDGKSRIRYRDVKTGRFIKKP